MDTCVGVPSRCTPPSDTALGHAPRARGAPHVRLCWDSQVEWFAMTVRSCDGITRAELASLSKPMQAQAVPRGSNTGTVNRPRG